MNKAKYLLLGLLLFSLVFVTAQEDDLFGGGGDDGGSLFDDAGGDDGGDIFGGGDGGDESAADIFGDSNADEDDPFGVGNADETSVEDDPLGLGDTPADDNTPADDETSADDETATDNETTTDEPAVDEPATDEETEAEDYQDPVFEYSKIPVTPERKVIDFYYPHTIAYAEVNILPGIDIEEINGDQVDIVEYRFEVGYMFEISDNFYISIGLKNELYDFTFQKQGNKETEALYAIDVPIGIHILLSDQLMFSIEATPGVHTDFSGTFDQRDIQIFGGLRATYAFSNTLALVAGAYVGPDISGYQVVPFGGIIWKPNSFINAEIIAPFNAKVTLSLTDSAFDFLIFYESLYFKQFRIDGDGALTQNEEDDFKYESMRVGLGVRYSFSKGVALEAILGGTLDGKFDANKDDNLDASLEGGSFFAKIGFSVDMSIFEN